GTQSDRRSLLNHKVHHRPNHGCYLLNSLQEMRRVNLLETNGKFGLNCLAQAGAAEIAASDCRRTEAEYIFQLQPPHRLPIEPGRTPLAAM
ncbi:MAG: hypothetical protein ORN28_07660, partial [Rhodoferax sp.]|nr:hypothetical protein [Rhodoferax sp.]